MKQITAKIADSISSNIRWAITPVIARTNVHRYSQTDITNMIREGASNMLNPITRSIRRELIDNHTKQNMR